MVTAARITAFATITTTMANIQKRQDFGLRPIPLILSTGFDNASIASSVYSACSCLRLRPSTVEARSTVQMVSELSDYGSEPDGSPDKND